MADSKPRELEELRDNVTAKLVELHRRATRARLALSPSRYWQRPWIRFALGVAVGFALGWPGSSARSAGRT